jgi:hypothetical protein
MASFFPINAPLVNYFFYNYTLTDPGPNIPIAGGKVFFFEDSDHTVEKPTYSDVSDPANPVVNTNPLVLNDAGATPLYYAEPGLYYIVVTGPDGDLDDPVWTFEHVNFEGGAGTSGVNVINYMPNGQFLLHNDLPATDDFEAGEIRADVTNIAYGGWTFERSPGSTATDFITFEKYTEWSANPTGNPLYAVRYRCTDFDAGDDYKRIRITYPDVNRFASDTQSYTISLQGQDNLAGSAPIDIYLVKNFGTGGDPEEETLLTTITLTANETNFYYSFTFGGNLNKNISPDGDDFVAIDYRFRVDEEVDVLLTCFQQQAGTLINPVYPETTQQQDVSAALGGGFPIPNPDGSDLYLTPRLTATGWVYDDSEIGEIIDESNLSDYVSSLHPTSNKMLADGSQYETAAYSPIGVPFARLQAKYWDDTNGLPIYGTGKSYFISVYVTGTNQFFFANNSPGIVAATADGSTPTGFTFSTIHTGIAPASGYFCDMAQPTATEIYIINTNPGNVGDGDAGTAPVVTALARPGSAQVYQITSFEIVGNVGAGDYFEFQTSNGGAVNWYAWFQIDGVGADPAIGGRTGIPINLHSGDTPAVVAQKITAAIDNAQATTVLTTAASAITAGSFFTANAITPGGTAVQYYVWYKKDGAGTDPAPSGRTGIEVDIVTGDTAAQVAQKTQIAINMKFFAAPNYQDMFFRGFGAGLGRYSATLGLSGNQVGTVQFDDNLEHLHSIPTSFTTSQAGGGATIDVVDGTDTSTGLTGGTESRPENIYVNRAIRY